MSFGFYNVKERQIARQIQQLKSRQRRILRTYDSLSVKIKDLSFKLDSVYFDRTKKERPVVYKKC